MKDELIKLIKDCNDVRIIKIIYQLFLNLKEQS